MSFLKVSVVLLVACLLTDRLEGKSMVTMGDLDSHDIELTEDVSVNRAAESSENSPEPRDSEVRSESSALEESITNLVEDIMETRAKRSSETKKKHGKTNREHLREKLRDAIVREARQNVEGFYHIPPSRLQLNEEEPGFFYVPPGGPGKK